MNQEKILIKINKKEWSFLGYWPQEIFSASFWIGWWNKDLIDTLQVPIKEDAIILFNNGYFIVNNEEIDRIKKWIMKNNNADFWNHWNKKVKKILEDNSKVVKDIDLADAYKEFTERAKKIMTLWVIAVFINQALELIWNEKFSKEASARYVKCIPKINTPLFLLERKLRNELNIADIKNEHSWIKTANFIINPVTNQDLKKILKHPKVEISKYKKLPKDIKDFLKWFSIVGYTKQASAEYFSKVTHLHYPLLKKIARKIGITYDMILQVPNSDAEEMLKGNKKYKAIKNNWLLMRYKNKIHIILDKKLVRRIADLFIEGKGYNKKQIKGMAVFPGNVKGRVSVITSLNDFHKFKQGNILVSTMTTPDFLLLMKNASAIVTDIGGLLCHAAVMAREMSKPCVIGTKVATKILKDGDEVEVDANNGIIRILN